MQWKRAFLVVLLVLGGGLVVFGVAEGDTGTYSLDVRGPIEEGDIQDDSVRLEYDELPTPLHEPFRDGVDSAELVSISDPPAELDTAIVRYRGDYYRLTVVSADAVKGVLTVSIAGGIVLILVSSGGFAVSRSDLFSR